MTAAGSGCSHRTAPVLAFSALTNPAEPAPAIVVLPPATYSTPPAYAADATLESPHVGQSPPMAMRCCHTGPAEMFAAANAYSRPFLLVDATSVRPPESGKTTGVVLQSES